MKLYGFAAFDLVTEKFVEPNVYHDPFAFATFAPNSELAYRRRNTPFLILRNLTSGEELKIEISYPPHGPNKFSADGRRILTVGSNRKALILWDRTTEKELRRFIPAANTVVTHTGLTGCGERVVAVLQKERDLLVGKPGSQTLMAIDARIAGDSVQIWDFSNERLEWDRVKHSLGYVLLRC